MYLFAYICFSLSIYLFISICLSICLSPRWVSGTSRAGEWSHERHVRQRNTRSSMRKNKITAKSKEKKIIKKNQLNIKGLKMSLSLPRPSLQRKKEDKREEKKEEKKRSRKVPSVLMGGGLDRVPAGMKRKKKRKKETRSRRWTCQIIYRSRENEETRTKNLIRFLIPESVRWFIRQTGVFGGCGEREGVEGGSGEGG